MRRYLNSTASKWKVLDEVMAGEAIPLHWPLRPGEV